MNGSASSTNDDLEDRLLRIEAEISNIMRA